MKKSVRIAGMIVGKVIDYVKKAAGKVAAGCVPGQPQKAVTELRMAEEFFPYPFGRHDDSGPHNGTAFRKLLAERFRQAQNRGERLEVVLDDVHGLGAAFLDEAFAEFAEQLFKESGQKLSEENLSFRGNLPHYEIYISKIWELVNLRYPKEGEKKAA